MNNTPRPNLRTLDEARAELLSFAEPLGDPQDVSTFDADGRVLAQDVVSPLQVPPADNSAMDGYAVRVADVPAPGARLPVSQRIAAGAAGQPLAVGTAARIFTGAPVPEGADAVVMQEEVDASTEGDATFATFRSVPTVGLAIRRSGEDVTRGAVVLRAGERLGPAALGLAAGVGQASLRVARAPRVALFSTGDELVMPGDVAPEAMRPGAIYNSNRFFLRALLARLGCEVQDLGVVPDDFDTTVRVLRDASAQCDLILTSGGVSVGEEDHIKPAVESLGLLRLWQISMKPGKPFAYGRVGPAHFIGLPGNPVSSFATFVLLVRPFLLRLQGATQFEPRALTLPAHFDWPRADKRREFLRARIDDTGGLVLYPNQGSGVLTSVAWAEGLVDIPAGTPVKQGDAVRFLPFDGLTG
ncbi:MAG: molybdopterin molybdotransferase MoeA [Burkholderiaceae bacterium]|nr:molybdopterin molybdotransferase MoeA [Burkholderiaceae bacterium]